MPDADRDYTLNAKEEKPPALSQCSECMAMYSGGSCSFCGKADPMPVGEREIVSVDDAEKFEFSSDEEAPSPALLPPVEVKWDTPGKVVEGEFMGVAVEQRAYGSQKVYGLRGKKRVYRLPGTTHLNALMTRVQIPDSKVRVTYVGEQALSGGKFRKLFKVAVDDGR